AAMSDDWQSLCDVLNIEIGRLRLTHIESKGLSVPTRLHQRYSAVDFIDLPGFPKTRRGATTPNPCIWRTS
ncbi:MAG: hypothetical protein WBW28_00980, partial [Pseudolabrys sp.]